MKTRQKRVIFGQPLVVLTVYLLVVFLVIALLDVLVANVLPELAAVDVVPVVVDTLVEGNIGEECSEENGANEHGVAAEDSVVKTRSERHVSCCKLPDSGSDMMT